MLQNFNEALLSKRILKKYINFIPNVISMKNLNTASCLTKYRMTILTLI